MKTVGIVCEYNPLHGGHKYLIDRVKSKENCTVVCVMSGNSTQRGELAVMPKTYRARTAIDAGADLVLELPFPYSLSSAEFFATAGVRVLMGAGVDAIAFGSDSGEMNSVMKAATRALQYDGESREHEMGTAREYFDAIGAANLGSNDILAVEYIKAIKREGAELELVAVKREGASYHGTASDGAYPSATQLRDRLAEHGLEVLLSSFDQKQLPPETRRELQRAIENGDGPISTDAVSDALVAFWRMADADEMSLCAECGGGVAQRLVASAQNACSFSHMMSLAATKRYTASRLRRAAIFGMCRVLTEDLRRPPAYVELLGASEAGCHLLSEISPDSIEIVSKPARIPQNPNAIRQAMLSGRLDALFTLALPKKKSAGEYFKSSPYILKE